MAFEDATEKFGQYAEFAKALNMFDNSVVLYEKKGGKFTPQPNWNDSKDLPSLDDNVAIYAEQIGIRVPVDVIVIDVDQHELIDGTDTKLAHRILKFVQDNHVKTVAVKTTSGLHLYFKRPKSVQFKSITQVPMMGGFIADYRLSYKNRDKQVKATNVVIMKNSTPREIVYDGTNGVYDIEELPSWAMPMNGTDKYGQIKINKELKETVFSLIGMKDGSGRNPALLPIQMYQAKGGATKDQIREYGNIINNYIFDKPLPKSEMETLYRDDAVDKAVDSAKKSNSSDENEYSKGSYMNTDLVAKDMISDLHLYTRSLQDSRIFAFTGKFWKNYTMNELWRIACSSDYADGTGMTTSAQRNFSLAITTKAPMISDFLRENSFEDTEARRWSIITKSGELNLKTHELSEPKANRFITRYLSIPYDSEAYNEAIDKAIDNMSGNDKGVRKLLIEFMAYTLITDRLEPKAVIIEGGGGNGKSTYTRMLKSLISNTFTDTTEVDPNISTVSVQDMQNTAIIGNASNSILNISEDTNPNAITETSNVKKFITGEDVQANPKYQQPYTFYPEAKEIITTNQTPQFNEKSDAITRRFVVLPLNGEKIDKSSDRYIDNLFEIINTDDARIYLLKLAVDAVSELIERNVLYEPEIVKVANENFKEDNDPLYAFIKQTGVSALLNTKLGDFYNKYQTWYSDNKNTTKGIENKQWVRRHLKEGEPQFQRRYGVKFVEVSPRVLKLKEI